MKADLPCGEWDRLCFPPSVHEAIRCCGWALAAPPTPAPHTTTPHSPLSPAPPAALSSHSSGSADAPAKVCRTVMPIDAFREQPRPPCGCSLGLLRGPRSRDVWRSTAVPQLPRTRCSRRIPRQLPAHPGYVSALFFFAGGQRDVCTSLCAFLAPWDLPSLQGGLPGIILAVRAQRVTYIAGETGCGKSTRVPQFLLEDGAGRIVVTPSVQPQSWTLSCFGVLGTCRCLQRSVLCLGSALDTSGSTPLLHPGPAWVGAAHLVLPCPG
jgi:hypothetical protein